MSTPPPLPSGPPPNIEASLTAIVVREYTPMEQNHIPLAVGDTIKVTDFGEKLFWTGTLSNGTKGVFPASHVEIRGRGRGRGGLTRGVIGGGGGRGGDNGGGRGGVRHSSYVPSNNGANSQQNSRAKSGYSSNPLVEEPTTRQAPPPINPRSSPIVRPLHGSSPESLHSNGAPSPTPLRAINDNHNSPSPPTPIRGAVRGRGYRGLSQSSPNTNSLSAKSEVPITPPVPEVPNNNNNNNNNNNVADNKININEAPSNNSNSNPNINQDGGQKKKTREDLRKDTLQELYLTEKTYIEDLETLINVFIFPLKTMGVLPDSTLYNIFSNVEVLINCNREMLKALEEKMSGVAENEEVSIGACFTLLADYFKMYKVYCSNQSTSLTTVDTQTKKNPQFKKNLDICHSDPRCKGLFLQSFLIKPIQRVCKYPLLLRELIRYTPEDHADYEPLQSAFAKINAVVTNINEAQREYEGLQRILDLQKLIDGIETLVEPGRRFHKEGELTFFKSIKSKHGEKRHVFFFSDLILLTTKKGNNKYEHKLSIPLGNCTLIVLADSDHIKNAFELSQKQLKKPCILSGDSPEELNTWTREIKNLIKMYQKKEIELKKKGFSSMDD